MLLHDMAGHRPSVKQHSPEGISRLKIKLVGKDLLIFREFVLHYVLHSENLASNCMVRATLLLMLSL